MGLLVSSNLLFQAHGFSTICKCQLQIEHATEVYIYVEPKNIVIYHSCLWALVKEVHVPCVNVGSHHVCAIFKAHDQRST